MHLPRRGFLRLISAIPAALAVFRSTPVQAAPVSEVCAHSLWLMEPKHSMKLCADCGIRQPMRPNGEIWVTSDELSALEDTHAANQRWMTPDGGFRFGAPGGPTYREAGQ